MFLHPNKNKNKFFIHFQNQRVIRMSKINFIYLFLNYPNSPRYAILIEIEKQTLVTFMNAQTLKIYHKRLQNIIGCVIIVK